MTNDILIRRDEKIPRGTKLAYRVVMDYPITLDADGWLDEGEDGITLDELEKRIQQDGWSRRYRSVLDALVEAGWKGEAIGDESWVPLEMDAAAPHHRPVAFETKGQASDRGAYYSRDREYVTLGQPCCPECHSFKPDAACDVCEDGIPAAVKS